MIIVPAILEKNPEAFKQKLDLVSSFASLVQIDIADGVFVPNKTVAVEEIIDSASEALAKLAIEWHLMVVNPLENLPIKPSTIIFHYEAINDSKKTIDAIKKSGHKVGIAFNPETPAEVLDLIYDQLDIVTVMSVNPGFQGSPFVPSSLKKIEEIKTRFPKLIVEIDGGVNESNLEGVAAIGVDKIVVGSGIWKSPDPAQKYQQLKDQLKMVL